MLWFVILFPLLGAILNGFFLRKAPHSVPHIVGTSVMGASFVCAVLEFLRFSHSSTEAISYLGFEWIKAGGFEAPFKLVFDRLSGFMTLIVTGIGTLIHWYAGGYMHDEKNMSRFFAYLNLFVFMMLLLVLGENMLVMFVGWEGVGLCSYLLIGYWFTDIKNADAGMKAFIVNRIGDIGFILGVFMTYYYFGTVSFSELKDILVTPDSIDMAHVAGLSLITFAMFLGVCGKSAQIPLYVWLPDAMAGPTPVSALIHAATMVTAGVYMMTRLNFMYYLAPNVMMVVAIVGAATALFAATIALVQTDIKKVLAYSTVSQLGYMVMACGVGAFGAGVFHLFTHACFKALLFLGAGSVIVAMHHEQDMRKMGGLARYMPKTHAAVLVGVLAIIGTPGLAGFFSKDEILWHAYLVSPWLWGVGVLAAMCTAFYMVRMYCLTFLGENRSDHHTRDHLHETPWHMWAPLLILAALSVIAGYLGIPEISHALEGKNVLHHYFAPVLEVPMVARDYWAFLEEKHDHGLELTLMGASVLLAMGSAFISFTWYRNGFPAVAERLASNNPRTYTLLSNKYFIDEVYLSKVVGPIKDMALFLYKIVDVLIIDGLVNGIGQACGMIGGIASFKMSGSVHRHGVFMVIGILCLMTLLVF